MLSRRQIDVQRANLTTMCRISVKSLLDYACLYSHVDDDCEEFINFCSVFEQMVSHRLRPHQKKVWHRGPGTPRHFWDVLLENHNRSRSFVFQTCIPNIEGIETLKSPKAKLRAFIRVALMEKQLSDYLYWLLENTALMRDSYMDGSLMTSEDSSVLCGDLIGLNAIDFNFCLKGNENELLGPLEISYGPFLKYKQTLASRSSDEIEMMQLSGKDLSGGMQELSEENLNDLLRLQTLEKDFRGIREQKDYLEEMNRLRERQLGEANLRLETMRVTKEVLEREWDKERRMVDACVLELQADISKLRQENEALKAQVTSLQGFKDRMEMKEVPMVEMAGRTGVTLMMEHVGDRTPVVHHQVGGECQIKAGTFTLPADQHSLMSSASDQIRLKEDSQSLVPLTGSLADVNVALLDPNAKDAKDGCREKKTGSKSERADNPKEVSKSTKRKATPEVPESSGAVLVDSTNQGVMEIQQDSLEPGVRADQGMTGQSLAASAIMESYVMADSGQTENSELAAMTSAPTITINVSENDTRDGNTGSDVSKEGLEPLGTVGKSDCGTSHPDLEREEEGLTSDPEIIDRANTSSDGSDAAWEMLSDAEQSDGKEKTDQ